MVVSPLPQTAEDHQRPLPQTAEAWKCALVAVCAPHAQAHTNTHTPLPHYHCRARRRGKLWSLFYLTSTHCGHKHAHISTVHHHRPRRGVEGSSGRGALRQGSYAPCWTFVTTEGCSLPRCDIDDDSIIDDTLACMCV
jgi:hypothetical protein